MQAAMQVYASFALIILAIVAIIAFASIVSAVLHALRRRFGSYEDFRTTTRRPDRNTPGASERKDRTSVGDASKPR
jgi:hypothetical protein